MSLAVRSVRGLGLALAIVFGIVPATTAQAENGRSAFAVVIGNNHSLGARRPDLHYADDDAAKYYEIMQTIAPERVTLLADFDADTARLFASTRAQARPPTRATLLNLQAELAEQLRAVAASGKATDLYFVFAGHGDIDEGTGFIELADGRFTANDLEAFLRAAHADRAHVILDSCNSFFMLGARRPGGRYYATPEDAVRALSARLPNVGVFLSTSAEGDAFEWSEIQSGVFSHVVRSGLLGAADANSDGFVDYLELAGFVATATAEVANPNLRPHVFARGPGGHDDVPIVSLGGRDATRKLSLAEPNGARVRLLNRDAVPLFDTHTEAGAVVSLAVPNGWADGAEIERGTRETIEHLTLPAEPVELALNTLPVAAARGNARGPDQIFQKLFMRPFGPKALAVYAAQLKAAKPEVFGVSRENSERMNLLLDQISSAERGQRLLSGSLSLGLTAFYGLYAASTYAFRDDLEGLSRDGADLTAGVMAGVGALWLGYGIYTLLTPWTGERLYLDYRAELSKGDYAAAFALANDRLRDVAASEARARWISGIGAGVLIAGSGVAWGIAEHEADTVTGRLNARTFGGLGVLLGLSMLGRLLFVQSPIERLVTIWQRDAGRLQLQPELQPLPGGAAISVSGRF